MSKKRKAVYVEGPLWATSLFEYAFKKITKIVFFSEDGTSIFEVNYKPKT